MVAVVGAPAERYLRKIARADHDSADFVAQVHEHLSAFAGLRVLERDIVHRRVLADVLEMLAYGIADSYLHGGDSQPFHQHPRIRARPVGGAEAGHGHAVDALAVQTEPVEGFADYEQRESAVQTAGNTYHAFAAVDMLQAAHERGHLNIEDFAVGVFRLGRLGRYLFIGAYFSANPT